MDNNIVLIETLNSVGTGFMYPCIYENNYRNQYFIVFTNSHVLQDIGLEQNADGQLTDYKEQICLLIYDRLGNKVEQEDICAIYVYNSGNCFRSEEDIAALLIAVKKSVPIDLNIRICHKQPGNRDKLYLKGYPGVLLNDEVCTRIQLEGMEKSIFPANEKIGVYQIADDYHWYNDNKDRNLLQGLSGSLVYQERNGQEELLGMAQSVSDIQQGENPFKLMYYIKFCHILKHLREANCVIYSRATEDTYQIQWIYGKPFSFDKKITLLLLGGSGAGKSSFAKDFAYHGNQLYSTSDGQTTRTKIIYNYRVVSKKEDDQSKKYDNQVEVKLLLKQDFRDQMVEKVGHRPAFLILQALFELSDNSIKDPRLFLENTYELLCLIKECLQNNDWWPTHMLDDIKAGIQHLLSNKQMLKCYENIIEVLTRYYSLEFIKYLLDEQYMNGIRNNQYQLDLPHDVMHADNNKLEQAVKGYVECAGKENMSFRDFQRVAVSALFRYKESEETREKEIAERLGTESFRKKYMEALLSIEGFFALKEFPDEYEQWREEEQSMDILTRDVQYDVQDAELEEDEQENREGAKKFLLSFYPCIKNIYEKIHEILKSSIIQKYYEYGIRDNKLSMVFDLDDMDEEKRKLLQKCLQVTAEGSLTGIVNYVTLYDMVSNEYAMLLNDLEIGTLQLVDTCGLDHVEVADKQELKNRLYDTLYYHSEGKRIKLEDISVLYLKKLDSGKPDELRQVLPCVREVIPAAPVYCVFTGIDIFYRTAQEVASLDWRHQGSRQPKAVDYLLSDKGKHFLNTAQDGDELESDTNRYLVMRNNLIPYCGKKQLVNQEYAYYRNNMQYVWKLLASIAMKEYSSLEIISTEWIDAIADAAKLDANEIVQDRKDLSEEKRDKARKEISQIIYAGEEFVRCIFNEASLKSYDFRYNTKQADITSFCKRQNLGYYGTYRHRLDQRFHEGYGKAVEKKGKYLVECFPTAHAALMGALKNMETKFLGSGGNLIKLLETNKNEFRNILEDMYDKELGMYRYNPFDEKYGDEEFTPSRRNEIFDVVFNFSKGLENLDILKRFTKYFFVCFKKQIVEDNRQKSCNLLKLNPEFKATLAELENDFLEKYQIDNTQRDSENQEEVRKKFLKLMEYYFIHP